MVTIIVYLFFNKIDTTVIFPAMGIYKLIKTPIFSIPFSIMGLIEISVSYNRIIEFLNMKEKDSFEKYVLKNEKISKKNEKIELNEIIESDNEEIDENIEKKKFLEENKNENENENFLIKFENAYFNLNPEIEINNSKNEIEIENKSKLIQNVNLTIYSGELIFLVGKIGSKKTSLLLSILGEVEKTKGLFFKINFKKNL
jgi:ABC-type multidrug transport system fused ATPase/permease subunit